MATLTDFRNRFTEFSLIPDEKIQLFLDDSILTVSTKWGTLRDLGILYLTAHYLSVAAITDKGSTSSPKNVVSQSVEGVSVSYGSSEATESKYSYYDSTSYGRRYLSLMRQVGIGGAALV